MFSSLLKNTKLLFVIVGGFVGLIVMVIMVVLLGGRVKPPAPGPTTLIVWGFDDEVVYKTAFDSFQQIHPNVTIQYEKQPLNRYFEKLKSRKTAGTRPDVFLFHNTWQPELHDILTTIPASIVTTQDYAKIFYPVAVNDLTVGDKVVGLPQSIDGLVVIYNPNLLAAKNITVAKDLADWENFYNATVKLTQKDTLGNIQVAGAAIGSSKYVTYFSDILGLMYLQQDINHFTQLGHNDDGNDIINFYLRFGQGFDKVWDTSLGQDVDAFTQEKVAMIFGSSQTLQAIKTKNPQLAFGVSPTPQLINNDTKQWVSWGSYWVWGVSSLSNQQDLSWQLAWQLVGKGPLVRANKARAAIGLAQLPYPRTDLASLQVGDPFLGAFITQAKTAKSFYFASQTLDTTLDGPGLDTTNVTALDAAITGLLANQRVDLSATAQKVLSNLATYQVSLKQ